MGEIRQPQETISIGGMENICAVISIKVAEKKHKLLSRKTLWVVLSSLFHDSNISGTSEKWREIEDGRMLSSANQKAKIVRSTASVRNRMY